MDRDPIHREHIVTLRLHSAASTAAPPACRGGVHRTTVGPTGNATDDYWDLLGRFSRLYY